MERYDEVFWTKRIAEQQGLGQGVTDYCRRHGLSRYTFHRWRKRLSTIGAPGLVEIRNTSREVTTGGLNPVELHVGADIVLVFRGMPDPQILAGFVLALRRAEG